MAVRRLLVVMEEDSAATLLCCDHTMDCTNSYLASAVAEISLARGARLNMFDLEESSPPHLALRRCVCRPASGL